MVSPRLFLPSLFLALAACALTSAPPPATGAAQDAPASLWTGETRTILIGDAARALARQCSRVSPGPVTDIWTPSEIEIAALEEQLILLVARELEQRGESPSPGAYYRQYAGFIIGGRRVIYVNGFDASVIAQSSIVTRRDPTRTWRDHQISICDGGSITFGAEYDPATRQFSNFAFNGQV